MISITNSLSKIVPLSLIFCITAIGYAQKTISMSQTVTKREVSMSDATGKRTDGIYKYYAKGDDKPFTGILFAKYPNGNYSSWQEYVKGVGQGKWINYYENGNYKEVGYYNNNLVEGPIKKYYENGIIKAEGNYKDWRIKIGTWKYYDLNGKLKSTIDYGIKGSIEEVQKYYERGEISYSWYSDILSKNGFKE
ncbi:toxin-antitoxin system YwqK family antitoxin [Aquimarina sp. SS2-1]|uniref:toxin-antitoxin system YwqK family antitoxin n=1 Tax=Aquimarina besae TaxID=3342247 RepID=UPI00366A8131